MMNSASAAEYTYGLGFVLQREGLVMSLAITRRELKLRVVRRYFNLHENTTAEQVFAHCAKEHGIPCAHDWSRVDAADRTCEELDIYPSSFWYYFLIAKNLEDQGLLSR